LLELYIRTFFPLQTSADTTVLIRSLRVEFTHLLKNVNWRVS